MKKKKLVLFVLDIASKQKYTNDLESFFGDHVDIVSYSLKEGIKNKVDGDLIMISSPLLTEYVKKYIPSDKEIVYPSRTIFKDGYEKLKRLKEGQQAMLVSNSDFFALDMLSFLHRIGINHIDFNPVFPDMSKVPNLNIAVTPGQVFYVPEGVEKVINIGWRVFDIQTLTDVASKLNINDETVFDKIRIHGEKIIPISYGMHSILENIVKSKENLSIIIDEVDDGILIIDNNRNIRQYNSALTGMLSVRKKSLRGSKLDDEVILDKIYKALANTETVSNELINIKSLELSLIVTKKPLTDQNQVVGYVYIIKDVTTIENLESELRKKLAKEGHLAKYTFNSIVGRSEKLVQCKEKGMKISKLDKPVLIIGDTGTGKELFSQSIHNYSDRRDNPFVAVNCAALPSELLESELFGYEDGAFTGARKGGKKGLFELAHGGTLFLDEVGDIALDVQGKLLRVLQEKEVMRIGGTRTFHVDVRIIAATNKDFKKLMKIGKVRKDLYYRLSILNLRLPALNEIREDIPLIVEHILKGIGLRKDIEPELMEVLMNHNWDGNVRELENCVEYIAHMSDEVIRVQDLPDDFYDKEVYVELDDDTRFPELLKNEKVVVKSILKILRFRSAGRRTIAELLNNQGIETTEYEIRKTFKYLQEKGFITYGKGRKGVELTSQGWKIG